MTIEELKDLIDSTINENGTKAITGKALNLALNEIANAVAEAATTGGGGSGVKRLYADIDGGTLTDPEQLASNAALYTEIVTAFTNGEFPPQVAVLVVGNGNYSSITAIETIYREGYGLSFTFITYGNPVVLELTSDGNCSIDGGGSGGSGVPS